MSGALRDLMRQARGETQAGQARPLLSARFAPAEATPAIETAAPYIRAEVNQAAEAPPLSSTRARIPLAAPREPDTRGAPARDSDARHSVETPAASRPEAPRPAAPAAPPPLGAHLDAIVAEFLAAPSTAPSDPQRPNAATSPPRSTPDDAEPAPRTATVRSPAPPDSAMPLNAQRHATAPNTRASTFEKPPPAPEVHIHIGRVELTALAGQPKAPPRSEQKPALSLDEYLRQRNAPRGGRA